MIKLLLIALVAFQVTLLGAMQRTPTFQVSPDGFCFARFVWNTDDPAQPFWDAPHRDNLVGSVLDLRTYAQLAPPGGGGALGYGLFILDDNSLCTGPDVLLAIDTTPDAAIRAADKTRLETALNLSRGALTGTTPREVLWELYTEHTDPTGLTGVKPILGDLEHRPTLRIGGHGVIDSASFDGVHLQNYEDVFRADYRRKVTNGVSIDLLKRWTGLSMIKAYGRANDTNADALMPPEYRNDGWTCTDRRRCTTLSDTFTVGADSGIENDTGDIAWDLDLGDIDLIASTDRATTVAFGGEMQASPETDLAGADHFAEANLYGTAQYFAVAVRVDLGGANPEWYYINANWSTGASDLRRVQGGSDTFIASGGGPTSGDLYRVDVSGSDLEVFENAVSHITATDTNITGNTQVSIRGFNSLATTQAVDNFLAEDTGAAPRRIIFISKVLDWLKVG